MITPFLSICILFFNKTDQTIDCVSGFLDAGCPIYVLNNGSGVDATRTFTRWVSARSGVQVIDSGSNVGVSAGRNTLIGATDTEWLLFVDNDITVHTADWLSKFLVHAADNPDVEVIIPKLYNRHDGCYAEYKSVALSGTGVRQIVPEDSHINLFPGGAAFIKRSLFTRLGGYDECMFVGLEDLELALRGVISDAPVRGLLVSDIEFDHDHVIVYANTEETDSALERYSKDAIGKSCEVIQQKHNVIYTGWEEWVDNQVRVIRKTNASPMTPRADTEPARIVRIALVADKRGWAFHNIATNLKAKLSQRYTFDIFYTDDYDGDYDRLIHDIYGTDYDLVHYFWREVILNIYFNIIKHRLNEFEDIRESFIRTKLSFSIYDHCLLEADDLLNYKIVFAYLSNGYLVSSERLYHIYRKIPHYPDPCRVIEDGVDPLMFYPVNPSRLGDSNRPLVVGWAGNSRWGMDVESFDYKGFSTIIKPALEELVNEGCNVVGKFADRNAGFIPYDRMNDYYNSIDIYVCASSIEGTPNPILESFACGVPVVTTDVGVVPQLFGEGQKKYILNVRSKNELKDKLRELIGSPEQRMKLSQENLRQITHWTRDNEAIKWNEFFSHVLTGAVDSSASLKRACMELPYHFGIEASIDQFLKDSISWRLTRPLRYLNWHAQRLKKRYFTS